MKQSSPHQRLPDRFFFALALVAFLAGAAAPATALAGGIEAWHETHGIDAKTYQTWLDRVRKEGLQPVDVSVCAGKSGPLFSAIAIKTGHPWEAPHAIPAANFGKESEAYAKKDYRLINMAGYQDGKDIRFAMIWVKDGKKLTGQSRYGMTADGFHKETQALVKNGFRPLQIIGYPEGKEVRYGGIFIKDGATTYSSQHLSRSGLQKVFDTYEKKGYGPISICAYPDGKEIRFAAVFIKNDKPSYYFFAEGGLTSARYRAELKRMDKGGYRPANVTAYPVGGTQYYDVVFFGKEPIGPSLVGKWGEVMADWPINPVHTTLLANGKVFMWPRGAVLKPVGSNGEPAPTEAICYPRIWDPATHKFEAPARPAYNVFCSGHSLLADGRLFVAGGHLADFKGDDRASIYDPEKNQWIQTDKMNAPRWYPTCITLANGDGLVVSGETFGSNHTPQVLDPGTRRWRDLSGATDKGGGGVGIYPFLHLAPNGQVFLSGQIFQSKYLDTAGKGKWTAVGDHAFAQVRDYGSSVMYEPGKVLVLGGGTPPTNTAEIINLNDAKPKWQFTDPMSIARRQQNATLLADGTVFVTGGTHNGGFNDPAGAVFSTELWDPKTGAWHTMAPQSERRLYHSIAILLPDATVLSAGGGEPAGGPADAPINVIKQDEFYNAHRNGQIFSPPYLFEGPRPKITQTPRTVKHNTKFDVETPDAKKIGRVTLVRLASTTHAQNSNQRFNELQFQANAKGLTVTAPANLNLAPPGHYMLFILSERGVPSVAKIIHLQ